MRDFALGERGAPEHHSSSLGNLFLWIGFIVLSKSQPLDSYRLERRKPGYYFSWWQTSALSTWYWLQNTRIWGSGKVHPHFRRKCGRPDSVPLKGTVWSSECEAGHEVTPQKAGEASNVGHLMKVVRNEQSQPKRETMRATTTDTATGPRWPKSFGVYIFS